MTQVISLSKCQYMAKELTAILDHGEAQPAVSYTGDNGSLYCLEQVISPIYETMVKVKTIPDGLVIDACLFSYLQSLTIITFNKGRKDHDTLKELDQHLLSAS
ncbi:hypothetical protein MKX03_026095 [Papaver bracteatum]|nr:hypothetical protein MKX03_026095 [Papaver bracteatum]